MRHIFASNERYELVIDEVQEEILLHLNVFKWNKTTLKMLREDLDQILFSGFVYGYDSVSFFVDEDVTTKFHNLVKPLDFETTIPGFIVGGWYTGDK